MATDDRALRSELFADTSPSQRLRLDRQQSEADGGTVYASSEEYAADYAAVLRTKGRPNAEERVERATQRWRAAHAAGLRRRAGKARTKA